MIHYTDGALTRHVRYTTCLLSTSSRAADRAYSAQHHITVPLSAVNKQKLSMPNHIFYSTSMDTKAY
jgi:hypothetical protein